MFFSLPIWRKYGYWLKVSRYNCIIKLASLIALKLLKFYHLFYSLTIIECKSSMNKLRVVESLNEKQKMFTQSIVAFPTAPVIKLSTWCIQRLYFKRVSSLHELVKSDKSSPKVRPDCVQQNLKATLQLESRFFSCNISGSLYLHKQMFDFVFGKRF